MPEYVYLSPDGVASITIDLPQEAQEWARLFASKQSSLPIGKQVYLNTLAVYALHCYLSSQGVESDLEQSHSWYPHSLSLSNAADLLITNIGRIECRPVLINEASVIEIPDTAWEDRVAYVAVGIGEVLDQVILLGFFPSSTSDLLEQPIQFSRLLPVDEFTEYLRSLNGMT